MKTIVEEMNELKDKGIGIEILSSIWFNHCRMCKNSSNCENCEERKEISLLMTEYERCMSEDV